MGVILARGAGVVNTTDFGVVKELSAQLDGVTSTFDVGESFENLIVFYNGVNVTPHIAGITGTTFSLDFVPRAGANRELLVSYNRIY